MRNFVKYFIFGVLFFTFMPASLLAVGSLSGYVYNDDTDIINYEADDTNQIRDVGESGMGVATIVKLCKGGVVTDTFLISSLSPEGNYTFNVSSFGKYTVIEDETNSSSCTVSGNPFGWSSSSSNYISVELTVLNPVAKDLNFGNFRDLLRPLTAADREKAYLFQNKPSDVYSLDLVTGKLTKHQEDITPRPAHVPIPFHVNGIGYNAKDGFFWGSAPRRGSGDGYIIRIGKDSSGNWATTNYGPIPSLSTYSYAGDIDKDGKLYIYFHSSALMLTIDLDPNSPGYLTSDSILLVGSNPPHNPVRINSTDWAFNPKDDMLYTVNNGSGVHSLYRINPINGYVENLGDTQISNSLSGGTYMGSSGVLPPGHITVTPLRRIFGGSFFTKDGFYYLYDNGYKRPTGEVFRIDVSNPSSINPTAVPFSKPRFTKLNDGVMFRDNVIFLDFGDAPDDSNISSGDGTSTGNYRTLLSDNGPRHQVPSTGATIFLGVLPPDVNNSENDGQPTLTATGDGVEEDGVNMNSTSFQGATIKIGSKINLDIATVGNGVLNAWIDFNSDGNFTNSERIAKDINGSSGTINLTNVTVPTGAKGGTAYARFRYSSDADLNSTGAASDGEVEDYRINIDANKNLFGAWDIDENISTPVIKTKIVNRDINLSVASLDVNSTGYASSIYSIVEASIYSGSNQLTTWRDVNLTDQNITDVEFGQIPTAHKVAYVAIQYFDANGTKYDTNLSEKFAIRPDRFEFDLPSKFGKAGELLDFTVKAMNEDNNNTLAYNEAYNVSFQIEYKESKSDINCTTGTINLSSASFFNGVLDTNVSYSEVGDVDFNISEIVGSEFAIVDKNDTNDSSRYISEANTTVIFTASEFVFKKLKLNDGAGTFTFYASDENTTQMGALLDISVLAVDGGGSATENYSDTCYAKDVNLSLAFNTIGNTLKNIVIADGSFTNKIFNFDVFSSKQIDFNLSKEKFINGEANVSMHINFDRNISIAKNPMNFIVYEVSATDNEGVIGIKPVDESSKFYYGRVHVPDYTGSGEAHNISVYQEIYCKNCDKSVFELANLGRESEDGIYWRVIPKSEYDRSRKIFKDTKPKNNDDFGYRSHYERFSLTRFDIDKEGIDRIRIKMPKLPYKDKITFETEPWLIFNNFGTRTTRSFNINLTSSATVWAGKGKSGKTIDANASERNYQKMDW